MKLHLITVVCAFALFILKLKCNQAYHLPQDSSYLQQLQNNYHHHHLQPLEDYRVHLKQGFPALEDQHFDHDFFFAPHETSSYAAQDHNIIQQQLFSPQHVHHFEQAQKRDYFHDLHMKQLAESAKDPKNLKNGIYQNGAVTYDLGLPNYKILNPYDPPEIITPNHPHYHEHLKQIKETNNFTVENFGVTPMSEKETISKPTSNERVTRSSTPTPYISVTTNMPAATTTTTHPLDTTTDPIETKTTFLPDQANGQTQTDLQGLSMNDIQRKLKMFKEMDSKNQNHSISSLSKDYKFVLARSNEDKIEKPKEMTSETSGDYNTLVNFLPRPIPEPIQYIVPTIPMQTSDDESKDANDFYNRNALPSLDHVRFPNNLYGLTNALSSELLYHPNTALPSNEPFFHSSFIYDKNHLFEEQLDAQERPYRSSSLESTTDSSHMKQLAESAKDRKNLTNDIYQNGPATYDLGLPNYKILNPYDAPEIITPNHPHYHEHLNQIKETNNFTVENVGVNPISEKETISKPRSNERVTRISTPTPYISEITNMPTTTMHPLDITTDPIETKTTFLPDQANDQTQTDLQGLSINDIQRKFKMFKEMDSKNQNPSTSSLSKDYKFVLARSNEDPTEKPKEMALVNYLLRPIPEPIQYIVPTIPMQTSDEESKDVNYFYNRNALPSLDHARFPSELLYHSNTALPSNKPFFHSSFTYDQKHLLEEQLDAQERPYRSSSLESTTDSSPPASTESSEATTTSLPSEDNP